MCPFAHMLIIVGAFCCIYKSHGLSEYDSEVEVLELLRYTITKRQVEAIMTSQLGSNVTSASSTRQSPVKAPLTRYLVWLHEATLAARGVSVQKFELLLTSWYLLHAACGHTPRLVSTVLYRFRYFWYVMSSCLILFRISIYKGYGKHPRDEFLPHLLLCYSWLAAFVSWIVVGTTVVLNL